MRFIVEIEMENDAFVSEEQGKRNEQEVARILKKLANRLLDVPIGNKDEYSLRDING